jgi:hypothetical protein
MGLAVVVGRLADLLRYDPEGGGSFRQSLAGVNQVLERAGLPRHAEPEVISPAPRSRAGLNGYPYSFLHHLRRFYAHAQSDPQWVPDTTPAGTNPAADSVLQDEMSMLSCHLLCHSDCEGYYLPIEFDDVLFDHKTNKIPGGMLGSSFRLMAELVSIAPKLGIVGDGAGLSDHEVNKINQATQGKAKFWIEQTVWLSLFEAARLSIEHRSAICFA